MAVARILHMVAMQRGKFKLLQLATKIKILRHLSLQTSFGKLVVTDHQRLEVLYVIIIQLLLFFVPEGLKVNLFSITLFNRSLDVISPFPSSCSQNSISDQEIEDNH